MPATATTASDTAVPQPDNRTSESSTMTERVAANVVSDEAVLTDQASEPVKQPSQQVSERTERAVNSELEPPSPLAAAGKVAFFLVLVLGLILLLAWISQKIRNQGNMLSGGSLGRGNQAIKVLASQSLGVKERIAVIEVGGKQLVIGITPQQINTLTELDEPLVMPTAAANTASFAELLKKAVKA